MVGRYAGVHAMHGRGRREERQGEVMAEKATSSVASLEHVWGSLVDLIKELTKLAKNANLAVERDLHPMREVKKQ